MSDRGVGMQERWLVGLDVDGTIILPDESLKPAVETAITRVRDAGHEVTLATGRSWNATEPWINRLGLTPKYVVCSNGAVTMRRTAGQWVRWHVEVFDPSPVLTLLRDRLPEGQYMVELADGERLYTGPLADWNVTGGRKVDFDELASHQVSRIVVVSPGHDEEDFHRLVEDAGLNEVSYAIGWTAWLDIAPQGVDKGTALARIRPMLEIDEQDVLVVGDGRNDVGMFDWARASGGRAVAMGQAPAEVKQAAAEITGSVDDDGLAAVLHSLLEASASA